MERKVQQFNATTLLRITRIGVIQGFDVEKQDKDVRKKIELHFKIQG